MSPRAALGLLLCCASACAGDDADPAAAVDAIAAPGPHAVGYRTLEASYPHPITGEPRAFTALVWYPAPEGVSGEAPIYVFREPAVAVIDAPAAALEGRPLVVLSHGHQGYPAGQSFLGEHLASHGSVVVAPIHVGNTFADGDARETDIYFLRPLDLTAALDAVRADAALGPVASGPVAVVGHSFGGYTAFLAAGARLDMDTLEPACAAGTGPGPFCSTLDAAHAAILRGPLADARVEAVVSLDPGDFDKFGAAGVAEIDVPVLHMVAEQSGFSPMDPGADPYWTALSNPDDRRVLLLGGAHNDFVESCGGGLDIRCSDLPAPPIYRMVRTYVQAFLLRTLLDDEAGAPALDGEVEVSGFAELTAR